jgi:hypothetical protein
MDKEIGVFNVFQLVILLYVCRRKIISKYSSSRYDFLKAIRNIDILTLESLINL